MHNGRFKKGQNLGNKSAEKHGQHKTSTYRSWAAMKARCFRKNTWNYSSYGGKGITVCDRWKKSFEEFFKDMGHRPKGTTIDRFPNQNGNYEPGNCRWATPKEQSKNRGRVKKQSNNTSGTIGVCWHVNNGKWRAYAKENRKQINLGCFEKIEDAIAARENYFKAKTPELAKEYCDHSGDPEGLEKT